MGAGIVNSVSVVTQATLPFVEFMAGQILRF